ncbi:MAG TPA: hypothetical protein VH593_32970 [Ktedonobacteraceae bacterium]|jgi:ribosomal protein S27AE
MMVDHAFMDHYDWRGRLLDEPDDDKPELRRHCAKCGAFLAKQPETHVRMTPTDWDYTYDGQGEVSGVIVRQEEQEIEAVWTCTRCGYEHDADEMCI